MKFWLTYLHKQKYEINIYTDIKYEFYSHTMPNVTSIIYSTRDTCNKELESKKYSPR